MMIQYIHLTNVHSSGVKVLDDAYFSASQGSFVAVIGESRTGKSTFLKMLGGEEKPTSGVLRIDHHDIYGFSDSEKRQWLSEVGMIFHDLKLFSEKTVEENIHFILQVKGASGECEKEAIAKLLSKAGLEGKAQSKPADLSSGEQLVVLALRAMIFRPRLLLADDPFQGLDDKTAALLFRFFLELNKSGSTVVLSTQQMSFLAEAKKAGTEAHIQWMKLDQGKLYPLEEAIPMNLSRFFFVLKEGFCSFLGPVDFPRPWLSLSRPPCSSFPFSLEFPGRSTGPWVRRGRNFRWRSFSPPLRMILTEKECNNFYFPTPGWLPSALSPKRKRSRISEKTRRSTGCFRRWARIL